MPHEINERDAQQGVEMAWHGLTKLTEEISFEKSPLNWTLERRPLFRKVGEEFLPYHQAEIVASDDQLPVGNAVSESYSVIENNALWDTLMTGLDDCAVPYKVVSIGSVCDRTKVFISVKLNEGSDFKIGNRDFKFYLNAVSTHDGSGKAMFSDSSVCVVCANTFGFNVNDFVRDKKKAIRFAVTHSKNANLAIVNVGQGIENLISNRAQFCAELDAFGQKKVTQDQAHFFAAGIVAPEAATDKGISTRARNVSEEIVSLFQRGAGNSGENRLDLFSAFTDRYTHTSAGENRQKQFVSSEFGPGQAMKSKVFWALRDDEGFAKMVKRGEELMMVA